ncbi:MAG TPA: hypothetical protein PKK61_00620 [Defluviitaleaceae bacterium]|nr:hypothetical protein [Candidatus Epulonipiscium sp.]HOA79554.1 hypothetical protein [Defluviitaleaceae bacterium]
MGLDETKIQLKILLELLDKKKKILEQIYTITENQYVIVNTDENDMDFFDGMVKEKHSLIEKVNEIDKHFLNIYNKISSIIKQNPTIYKDIIKDLQDEIRDISKIDTKIKIQEEKNRQELLINMNSKSKKQGLLKNRKQVIESYKKYSTKKEKP